MAPGHCRSVYDCPMALRLMRKGISTTEADHLRSLLCTGQEGSYPWICCETATTPTQSNDVPGDVYFPDSSGGVGEAEQQPTVTDRPATKPRDGDAGDSANRSGGGSLPPIGTCGLDSFGQRIYGGQVAGLNEFPWMALLQYRNNGKSDLFIISIYITIYNNSCAFNTLSNGRAEFLMRRQSYQYALRDDRCPLHG